MCKLNKHFPPQLALQSWCFHQWSLSLSSETTFLQHDAKSQLLFVTFLCLYKQHHVGDRHITKFGCRLGAALATLNQISGAEPQEIILGRYSFFVTVDCVLLLNNEPNISFLA